MRLEHNGHISRWEDTLSEEAREWVETRRNRYLPSYNSLHAQGYRVVAELSPRSGRLVTAGRRVGYIQELEATDIIREMEESDRREGRKRTYDFIKGCVEPTRRDGRVATRSDLRAYKFGISIVAREMSQQEIDADKVLQQIMDGLATPVAVAAFPSQRRVTYFPQPAYR